MIRPTPRPHSLAYFEVPIDLGSLIHGETRATCDKFPSRKSTDISR